MVSKITRILMTILWVGVLVTVTVLFYVYFRSVSEAIYQESSDHLSEVYEQVDHNFDDFIKMNWMR